MRSSLTADEWCQARNAVEAGESLRAVAAHLGVHHATLSRAARRDGWVIPSPPWAAAAAQEPARTSQTAIYGSREASSGDHPTDAREALQIASERSSERREATPKVNDSSGPPQNEQSARLWVCRTCGLVGFDPGRRSGQEWHTPELCAQRVAHFDRVMDDTPKAVNWMMEVPW